jgi:hypothetical protein
VFAGKDASRALATSSLRPGDIEPEFSDLGDEEKGVLDDWFTLFFKRYDIIGKVTGRLQVCDIVDLDFFPLKSDLSFGSIWYLGMWRGRSRKECRT